MMEMNYLPTKAMIESMAYDIFYITSGHDFAIYDETKEDIEMMIRIAHNIIGHYEGEFNIRIDDDGLFSQELEDLES